MKKTRKILVACLVFAFLCMNMLMYCVLDTPIAEAKIYSNATLEDDFADDRVMVVLNQQSTRAGKEYTKSDFTSIGSKSVINYFVQDKNNTREISEDARQILRINLNTKSKQNVLDTIDALMKDENVLYAGPDYKLTLGGVADNSSNLINSNTLYENALDMQDAWSIAGTATVKVGVLDSGINSNHEDLLGRVNTTLGCEIDEDDCIPILNGGQPHSSGALHGTEVAGIIGAIANNNKGINGVCQTAELVSINFCQSSNQGYASQAIAGIQYADTNNIPILCMSSWYWDNHCRYDRSFKTAIDQYYGLFVSIAGNGSLEITEENPFYPAMYDCDNMIIVGGMTTDIEKVSNSNYSETYVDIFAPGEGVHTTTLSSSTSAANSSYAAVSGTSIAAPFVAGAAAMILSKYPTMNAHQIKHTILANKVSATSLAGLCKTGGYLNVYDALSNRNISHTYDRWISTDNLTHHRMCSLCEYRIEYNHVKSYSQITSTQHCESCSSCSYNRVVSHTFTTVSTTATDHLVRCVCGYEKSGIHVWMINSMGGYVCKVCNRYADGIPEL
ncbi:MAG: S8 family serine peptidase [Clostridia bacterium]|nr:S8 family serine peptidase [Clostridia bacterium]